MICYTDNLTNLKSKQLGLLEQYYNVYNNIAFLMSSSQSNNSSMDLIGMAGNDEIEYNRQVKQIKQMKIFSSIM